MLIFIILDNIRQLWSFEVELRVLSATDQAKISLIDVNDLREVKLVPVVELGHLVAQIFIAHLKKPVVIRKLIVCLSFIESVQTSLHPSTICDYYLV